MCNKQRVVLYLRKKKSWMVDLWFLLGGQGAGNPRLGVASWCRDGRLYYFSQRLLYLCLLFWAWSSPLSEHMCPLSLYVCVLMASWPSSSNENNMLTKGWPQYLKMTTAACFLCPSFHSFFLFWGQVVKFPLHPTECSRKQIQTSLTTIAGKMHGGFSVCIVIVETCVSEVIHFIFLLYAKVIVLGGHRPCFRYDLLNHGLKTMNLKSYY